MANEPSPLALLLQASELMRQRHKDFQNTNVNVARAAKSKNLEAERDPSLCNALRSVEDAVKAYASQACIVLDEFALVISSMDEIEALLKLLRGAEPPYRLLCVVIKGPVPQGDVVDPLVAQMRAALEGKGFRLQHGNLYNLPYYDLPQDFLRAAPAERTAPAAQQAGGRSLRWRTTPRRLASRRRL